MKRTKEHQHFNATSKTCGVIVSNQTLNQNLIQRKIFFAIKFATMVSSNSNLSIFVFIYICLLLKFVHGKLDVTIFQAGYNYYSVINIHNSTGTHTYNTLLDTGNPTSTQTPTGLSIIESIPSYNSSKLTRHCAAGLGEDGYYSIIFNPATKIGQEVSTNPPCPTDSGVVSFNSASPPPSPHIHVTNYSVYAKFTYPNNKLYDWRAITGDMGLAYCSSGSFSCPLSYFQTVLKNTSTNYTQVSLFGNQSYTTQYINYTNPLLFALDLNNASDDSSTSSSSGTGSSMQLGYLNPKYQSHVAWSPKLTNNAVYHQFNIQSMSMCGINLLANWSTTWPVMVDTGKYICNPPL